MIKIRVLPGNGVVAIGARRNGKHGRCGGMLRIGCLLPSRKMATCMAAICRYDLQIVIVAHVTARARNIRVPIG